MDEEAASPFLTSVGGRQFTPSYLSGFDTSLVSDGIEAAWNDNAPSTGFCPVKDATGGGRSVVFPKPQWQTGFNVPNDGARDIPDIAMGAAAKHPGFLVFGKNDTDTSVTLVAVGGTSIATPMWAAISRLIAQSQGVTRQANGFDFFISARDSGQPEGPGYRDHHRRKQARLFIPVDHIGSGERQ